MPRLSRQPETKWVYVTSGKPGASMRVMQTGFLMCCAAIHSSAIAHRLRTIRNTDLILVLEEGAIVGQLGCLVGVGCRLMHLGPSLGTLKPTPMCAY